MRMLLYGQALFDAGTLPGGIPGHDQETSDRQTDKGGRYFCCANCRSVVATAASQVEFNGAVIHYRTNPAGQSFCFRCFDPAPGCVASGVPTYEHSWFQNYRWQFAHCLQCGIQLGWYFTGERRVFGLIQRSLIECDER